MAKSDALSENESEAACHFLVSRVWLQPHATKQFRLFHVRFMRIAMIPKMLIQKNVVFVACNCIRASWQEESNCKITILCMLIFYSI